MDETKHRWEMKINSRWNVLFCLTFHSQSILEAFFRVFFAQFVCKILIEWPFYLLKLPRFCIQLLRRLQCYLTSTYKKTSSDLFQKTGRYEFTNFQFPTCCSHPCTPNPSPRSRGNEIRQTDDPYPPPPVLRQYKFLQKFNWIFLLPPSHRVSTTAWQNHCRWTSVNSLDFPTLEGPRSIGEFLFGFITVCALFRRGTERRDGEAGQSLFID